MVCASGDAEAHRQLYVAAPRKVRRGWIKVHRGVAARSTQRTGAQRMSYTLAAAAAACGLNKSTVLRAIKALKLTFHSDHSVEANHTPRILGSGKVMMPADLKRLHKYIIEMERISVISDEIRTIVEGYCVS